MMFVREFYVIPKLSAIDHERSGILKWRMPPQDLMYSTSSITSLCISPNSLWHLRTIRTQHGPCHTRLCHRSAIHRVHCLY